MFSGLEIQLEKKQASWLQNLREKCQWKKVSFRHVWLTRHKFAYFFIVIRSLTEKRPPTTLAFFRGVCKIENSEKLKNIYGALRVQMNLSLNLPHIGFRFLRPMSHDIFGEGHRHDEHCCSNIHHRNAIGTSLPKSTRKYIKIKG